jgi:hypothetical protein
VAEKHSNIINIVYNTVPYAKPPNPPVLTFHVHLSLLPLLPTSPPLPLLSSPLLFTAYRFQKRTKTDGNSEQSSSAQREDRAPEKRAADPEYPPPSVSLFLDLRKPRFPRSPRRPVASTSDSPVLLPEAAAAALARGSERASDAGGRRTASRPARS